MAIHLLVKTSSPLATRFLELKKKLKVDWIDSITTATTKQAAEELKRQEQKKMIELLKRDQQRGRR